VGKDLVEKAFRQRGLEKKKGLIIRTKGKKAGGGEGAKIGRGFGSFGEEKSMNGGRIEASRRQSL